MNGVTRTYSCLSNMSKPVLRNGIFYEDNGAGFTPLVKNEEAKAGKPGSGFPATVGAVLRKEAVCVRPCSSRQLKPTAKGAWPHTAGRRHAASHSAISDTMNNI